MFGSAVKTICVKITEFIARKRLQNTGIGQLPLTLALTFFDPKNAPFCLKTPIYAKIPENTAGKRPKGVFWGLPKKHRLTARKRRK